MTPSATRHRSVALPWRLLAVITVAVSALAVTTAPAQGDDLPANPVTTPSDLWAPSDAPASGSYLYLADPSRSNGEIFGQGYASDANGPAFRVATDGDEDLPQTVVTIFGGTGSSELQIGLYQGAGEETATGGPALAIHQWPRSCANPQGWFAVDEVAYHGDELDRITFRFSQTCDSSGEPLRGKVSWVGQPSILTHTTSGPRRGGWPLQVMGDHLSEATSMTVDGDEVAFTASSPVLTATAPETSLGTHEVVVTTPGGTVRFDFQSTPNPALAPHDLAADVGKNSVGLSWTAPSDLGDAPATSVQVAVRHAPGSGGPGGFSDLAPDQTTASFGRLIPGSTYDATVTYMTDVGFGEPATIQFTVPPLDHSPFVEEMELVTQQYTDFVGRTPTVKERTAAVDALRSGTTTPDEFVASMRNRPEWGGVRAPLTRLYSSYFDRLPDAGGLTFWAKRLRSGTSLAQVSATFAASSEFARTYGKLSNGAFVDLVYRNVLHRQADPSGRTYWIRKLNAGAERGPVMTSFSESPEHIRTMTTTVDTVLLYSGMLRRMPTTAELPAAPGASLRARTATAAVTVDPTALADQLRHSPAYASRF